MSARTLAIQSIASRIATLRDRKVMLDADLAKLYQVPTKALVQAVKRNRARFPPDFMFRLTEQEVRALRSQFVTLDGASKATGGRGMHRKYLPRARDP